MIALRFMGFFMAAALICFFGAMFVLLDAEIVAAQRLACAAGVFCALGTVAGVICLVTGGRQ